MKERLYRIPPLKWVLVDRHGYMPYWTAQTPYGWYYHAGMLLRHGYAVMYRVQGLMQQRDKEKRFNNVEEAKEAADADYREFMSRGLEEVLPVSASITSVVDVTAIQGVSDGS